MNHSDIQSCQSKQRDLLGLRDDLIEQCGVSCVIDHDANSRRSVAGQHKEPRGITKENAVHFVTRGSD